MIEKEELIDNLKEFLKTEELLIPLYAKHITNSLFFSEFKKEEGEELKNILINLGKDSQRHKKIFEGLINRIGKAQERVY